MRKHKYRAWKDNKMYEVIGLELYKDGTFEAQIIDDGCCCTRVVDDLLQFTGLLDKNGKEIYEEDVVKGEIFMYKFIGQIKWSDKYGFRMHGREYYDDFDISKMYALNHHDKVEIIGNIYENPELNDYHLEPITIKTKE